MFVACFLAVFALAPTFDAVICEADEPATAHALADPGGAIDRGHDGHTDSSGICAHGHCHQSASEVAEPSIIPVVARIVHEPLQPVLLSIPVSNRHFRLIRPPRV